MFVLPPQESGVSILTIESGFTVIAIAVAYCWPRLGASFFFAYRAEFRSVSTQARSFCCCNRPRRASASSRDTSAVAHPQAREHG